MPFNILNKFTSNLRNALAKAINLAWQYKQSQVMPFHLYLGLAEQTGSIAGEILQKTKLTAADLKKYLAQINAGALSPFPQLSPQTAKTLEKATVIAFNHQHVYIGTEHLLLALLQNPDEHLLRLWKQYNVNTETLKKQLINILKNTSRFPNLSTIFNDAEETAIMENEEMPLPNTASSALNFFCTDLTNDKIQSKIDPVIGREKEIERMIHILSRRTKNNPVLLGEAGVGKTAIVEGLAKRIIEKKVPEILLDKKIYRLDLGLVVAGTMYRGEFEARFKQIIEELEKNTNIILFIDEIHTLMGAGGSGGNNTMDAANILKPSLARGEVRCIGATTSAEYKKHIESDTALDRRFQPIIIEEPSSEETVEIINGIKNNYEKYHRVKITHEAIIAAVKLSSRYIQEKFLPDKAIDLIDEAAAKIKINEPLEPEFLMIRQLEKQLEELSRHKISLVKQEQFAEALKIKDEEKNIKQRLNELQNSQAHAPIAFLGEVKEKDIAEIISKITNVPTNELLSEEKKQLLNLHETLDQYIIGQKEATKSIADFIRRSRAGLTSPHRPAASFIFLGPSGVGKTELAKTLARILFGDEKALIRLDMSEYSEKFNISKLIGAPAGYVGYKESVYLVDQVKKHPYSIVLFDEIEKAHPDIFNLLLQILEDGHITDATGRKINFKNTIIIMTSNIGLKEFSQQARIGFGEDKKTSLTNYEEVKNHVLKQMKDHFKPEFLNRIDKIIVFKPLKLDDLIKIAELEAQKLANRLEEKTITLKLSKKILKYIAESSFSPDQGARAIRKTIEEIIEGPLAEKILAEKIQNKSTVKIKLKNKQLTFS
jgi:ATP-dependent Clp protease ATP-binding subunit ClpC